MTHRTAGRLIWLLLAGPFVFIALAAGYVYAGVKLHEGMAGR